MSHNTDYGTEYSYDMNSNITSLTRKGISDKEDGYPSDRWIYDTIDSLAYTLNGNQLKRIDDRAYDPVFNGSFNFADGSSSDVEYLYDANGNMTKSMNKGITAIEYNYLNLPSCITFNTGHAIEYIYDTAGTKRSAIYKVQPESVFAPIEGSEASPATAEPLVVQSRRDYCGNRIYNTEGQLSQLLTDNGYIEGDKYHFYVKDYQGNNRVVFDQDGTIEQLNHYYPYGGLFSEGTATTAQPYKFGGKEFDRMNGLDLYDFGARMLDSATPTFMTIDRYAEKYPNISPYAYCGGNPIANIDVNGDSIAVLNYGSGKDQHLAILIQNKEGKWAYYSVNGNNMHSSGSGSTSGSGRSSGDSSFSGGNTTNNTGEQTYDSPQDFLDSKNNEDEYGYSSAYIIPTSSKQDRQIENSFKKESETNYNLITNNCADAVQNSMKAGGLQVSGYGYIRDFWGNYKKGERTSSIPSQTYRYIMKANRGILITPTKK